MKNASVILFFFFFVFRIKQEVSEIEEGDEGDDDVPQLHFPSTSDGDLSLQPSATLRTGFEMLHSLERQQ